jgi:hypothetical protein
MKEGPGRENHPSLRFFPFASLEGQNDKQNGVSKRGETPLLNIFPLSK